MVLYCIVWPGVHSEEISLLRRLFLRTFEEDYFNLLLYTKICFEIYASIIAIKDFVLKDILKFCLCHGTPYRIF